VILRMTACTLYTLFYLKITFPSMNSNLSSYTQVVLVTYMSQSRGMLMCLTVASVLSSNCPI
jgi:hypothetical protein